MITVLCVFTDKDSKQDVMAQYQLSPERCADAYFDYKRATPHIKKSDFSRSIIALIENERPSLSKAISQQMMQVTAGMAGLLLSHDVSSGGAINNAHLVLDYRKQQLAVYWIHQ